MKHNEIVIVMRGIGWIAMFFAPLIFARIAANEDDNDSAFTAFMVMIGLQSALVLSLVYSVGK